jgi:ATP sulfurylase
MLDIKFKVQKKCNKKDIIKKICEKYSINKLKISDVDKKINEKNINNVSQFIVNIKRLGYDMWFTIPLIFDAIYEEYELSGIKEANVINDDKIYFQRTNNVLGFMCYVLVNEGFINNVHIFERFNI